MRDVEPDCRLLGRTHLPDGARLLTMSSGSDMVLGVKSRNAVRMGAEVTLRVRRRRAGTNWCVQLVVALVSIGGAEPRSHRPCIPGQVCSQGR